MKLKHTSGEWRIEESTKNGYEVWGKFDETSSMLVAICGHSNTFDKANAHLIAVAPEMLEKKIEHCKRIIEIIDVPITKAEILLSDIYFDNKEIIEKATGMKIEEILEEE